MTAALQRLPDWPERLAAYLAAAMPVRFAWGSHDCVCFAAGAVQAITGQQVLPAVWADRAEAARVLRRLGGLVPAMGATLPVLSSPTLAQRGDLVLVQTPDHRAVRRWIAVADGARWWAPQATGLCCGPMVQATMAWGVGHG